MMIELRPIELAGLKGLKRFRRAQGELHLDRSEARELAQEFAPALANKLGEVGLVVGEVQERRRGEKFLALEQHGRRRHQQHQRRHGPRSSRTCELMEAQSPAGVRDLIVVWTKATKADGLRSRPGAPRRL